jgi:N-acetylmuramoyl-L-alanine amidase
MPTQHTVKQGEQLSSIAERHGFSDYRTVWDHPDNAALKQLRKSPHVLLPGDVVTIPDRAEKAVAVETGKLHVFLLDAEPVRLRLRVQDCWGDPRASADCVLTVEGSTFEVVTDGDGYLDQEIPASAERATLTVGELELDLRIGHLDPVDATTGLQARLNNLGYYTGELSESGDEPDEELLAFAIELFQWDNDFSVDGLKTADLLDKLRSSFGC